MDYSFVTSTARIALYDDMLSSPRIVEIPPADTMDFIGQLSSQIYNLSREMGGGIPFSAIRQVTENFIHAEFREIVVSIMDEGNTIRFTYQGPGISDKQRAQLPGFSSATEEMKRYIDGVGSGLPIVREYLDVKHGTLTLDDNLNGGSVVTLSLTPQENAAPMQANAGMPGLIEAQAQAPAFATSAPVGAIPAYSAPANNGNMGMAAMNPAVAGNAPIGNGVTNAEQAHAAHTGVIPPEMVTATLSKRGQQILALFRNEGTLGVQDISTMTDIPLSSTHTELRKLEEAGLIDKLGKKRVLSTLGRSVVGSL